MIKLQRGSLKSFILLNIYWIKMNNSSQCGLTRGQSFFVLMVVIWPWFEKHFDFVMSCFHHLVIHFPKCLTSNFVMIGINTLLKWDSVDKIDSVQNVQKNSGGLQEDILSIHLAFTVFQFALFIRFLWIFNLYFTIKL